MRKILLFLSFATLASCTFTSKTGQEGGVGSLNKKSISLASLNSDKDPVCNMTLHDGEIADTMSYNQQVFGFCAPVCKQTFAADPLKYLVKD